MIKQGYDFGVERSFRQKDTFRMWFGRYDNEGRFCYAKSMTFGAAQKDSNVEDVAPSMILSSYEAQILANQLWAAGIRPEQSGQSQGQFEAQSRHLEDMRTLVFK
jgi:hypothetical protein